MLLFKRNKPSVNFIWQSLLPKRLLSLIGGRIADSSYRPLKNFLCRWAIRSFNLDLKEALSTNIDDYPTFNDFFDRHLLPKARPIDGDKKNIVSPADGTLSGYGTIYQGKYIQSKNHHFQVSDLLQNQSLANDFEGGNFATIYLSPSDYHRVHIPYEGKLLYSQYIPGKLFSVNEKSVKSIVGLFAVNERCVCLFEAEFGKFLVIFVGALLVSGIRLKWLQSNPSGFYYPKTEQLFQRGDEIGFFKFGSTVNLLFQPNVVKQFSRPLGQKIKMGEGLANLQTLTTD